MTAFRTLHARPADRIEMDKARMPALPPVDPPGWWRSSLRLPRDHYVRIDTNGYSIHPPAIGRSIGVPSLSAFTARSAGVGEATLGVIQ